MKDIFKNMWEIGKLYKWLELVGVIFTILYTVAVFLSPILSKYLIDEVIPGNSVKHLIIGIGVFFTGCICQPVFGYLKNLVFMKISQNITFRLREEMFNKILNAPMQFFDKCNNGAIVSRISNDGRSISEFITNFFIIFIKNIVLIFMIIIGMLMISKEITLIIVSIYLFYFIVNWRISHKFSLMSKKIQESYDDICIKINRSVGLISTIKAFNQEDEVKKSFREIMKKNYLYNIEYRKLSNLISSLSNGMMITSLSIVYGIGSLFAMNGELTLGSVVAMGLYFQLLASPISELINSNIDIHTTLPIFKRIKEYMNLEGERNINESSRINLFKKIELKNVSFKYNDGSMALDDINLELPSKGMFAIVGSSGAGKSSLVKLLSGFYDTYYGQINIDDKELKEYSAAEIRKIISLVSQDIELFNESIKDNIKIGMNVDDSKIEEIIRVLNLENVIGNLELGYDTIINERVNLSGGEKQRLSIARALVKDSLIYIFDEPTAALDTLNEKRIKSIFEDLAKQKLVIIITHNLNLLNKADWIYTMRHGKIIEEGTYEYLMKQGGYFSKLIGELSEE